MNAENMQGDFAMRKKKTVVEYEQNFIEFPLFTFSPDKIGSTETVVVEKPVTIDGAQQFARFELSPTQGLGGKFDHAAFRKIEKVLFEAKKAYGGKIPEIVPLGSLNSLAIMLAGGDNEEKRTRVKTFFKTMLGYHISSEYAIQLKDKNKKTRITREVIQIYKGVAYDGEMIDGIKADQVFLKLGPEYRDNINAGYIKKFNSEIYEELDGPAKRTYEILSQSDKYIHSTGKVLLPYKTYCLAHQIKEHKTFSRAEDQLSKISKQLIAKEILSKKPKLDKETNNITFECNAQMFHIAVKPGIAVVAGEYGISAKTLEEKIAQCVRAVANDPLMLAEFKKRTADMPIAEAEELMADLVAARASSSLKSLLSNTATVRRISKIQRDIEAHISATSEPVPNPSRCQRPPNSMPDDIF